MAAVLSSSDQAAGAFAPSMTFAWCAAAEGRTVPTEQVGTAPTTLDDELEQHIKDCGWLMQCAMNRWEQSGCFAARGEADRYRILMENAIRSRSPAQVAAMAGAVDRRIQGEPGSNFSRGALNGR